MFLRYRYAFISNRLQTTEERIKNENKEIKCDFAGIFVILLHPQLTMAGLDPATQPRRVRAVNDTAGLSLELIARPILETPP